MFEFDPYLEDSTDLQISENDTVLFVVYKQALYGHGIHGVAVDVRHAHYLAHHGARYDKGDYRSYDIYTVPLDKLPRFCVNYMKDFGWMNAEPIASVPRLKGHPEKYDLGIAEKASLPIYLVYKQGYCGQGVHGMSKSLDTVKMMADAAAGADEDDYHSYDIYEVIVNALPERLKDTDADDLGWMNTKPVYSKKKTPDDANTKVTA